MDLRQKRLINAIQEIFNAQTSGHFIFPDGEHEGPLIIRRSCTVDGSNSTLWARKGPVLIIEAPNVIIKNIRIEITEDFLSPEERTAIITSEHDTQLVNVEVFGSIKGFPGEAEDCELPRLITLGDFASDSVNNIIVPLETPSKAEIVNNLRNIEIQPAQLLEGTNIILFSLEPIEHNTVIYGDFFVNTLVKRRIYITGTALNGAPELHGVLPEQDKNFYELEEKFEEDFDVIPELEIEEKDFLFVQKGQRISLSEIQDAEIKIEYTNSGRKRNFELDMYVFLLDENGKVSNDDDLIFWGNVSGNPALKLRKSNECPSVYIELAKIESRIERISVCLSIYGNDPSENFSLSLEPAINIYAGDKIYYKFPLKDLCLETTIEAVEFYRYDGEWRIKFIGLGWQKSLRDLCINFGVDVE